MPRAPDQAELAEKALAAVPMPFSTPGSTWSGSPAVMELEQTEPSPFPHHEPGAAARCSDQQEIPPSTGMTVPVRYAPAREAR
jgi:hypothetical protein